MATHGRVKDDGSFPSLLRQPMATDGLGVHRLVEQCPPLDRNSQYCNLLQCTHFAETCAVAVCDDRIVGFVSAYKLPSAADTLFVWQVAVSRAARGQGLGKRLLREVLSRPTCREVAFLEASITSDNEASRRMFLSLARDLNCAHESATLFDSERHFGGAHATEILLRIGAFKSFSSTERGDHT